MALWFTTDKIFALWLALILYGSTLYYYFFQSHDPLRCQSLISDGFWLDPIRLTNWQPTGCMIHTYKSEEAQGCFEGERVVFIGGSRTRSLFNAILDKINLHHAHPTSLALEANREVQIATAELNFFWDTALNGTELRHFRMALEGSLRPPKLVVMGLDDEFVRQQTDPHLMEMTVESAIAAFGTSSLERARRTDSLVVMPAFTARTSLPTHAYRDGFAAAKVHAVNDALWKYSEEFALGHATVFNQLSEPLHGLSDKELDLSSQVKSTTVDILLNLACNRGLPKHYPYSSTCCNTYPESSLAQLLPFIIPAALLLTASCLWYAGYTIDTSILLRLTPRENHLYPLLSMGAIAWLCWLCDRTNIPEKAQKQTSPLQFFALMGLIIIGSLATVHTSDRDLPFLNRNQTDEWKGWMQVAILVYHYVGVSKTDWIYSYMRVCPTSYLFMTGFGHTVYFLKKGDYSFKRVSATMLRLNLLNALLAYAMGNDWLLYYFAPLVTWNFFVVYFTLWVGHQHNHSLRFLLGKIVVSSAINAALYHAPGAPESIWWVPKTVLRMEGDLREWRFRVTLDQYSIVPGMLSAIVFLRWDSQQLSELPCFLILKRVAIILAAAVIPAYAVFEARLPSKFAYNNYHPYTGWAPCVAFVILRNSTPWLRRTHNALFAWFGRGSLETFLLQFHLWLAADTAGLLVVPGLARARALNALVTTSIFLWVASKATEATGPIIAWLMAADAGGADGAMPASELKGTIVLPHVESETTGWWQSKMQHVWLVVQTDFRVRIGMLLGAMVLLNWAY